LHFTPTLHRMENPRDLRFSSLGVTYLVVFTVLGASCALLATTWIKADSVLYGTLLWVAFLIAPTLVGQLAEPPPKINRRRSPFSRRRPPRNRPPGYAPPGFGWLLVAWLVSLVLMLAVVVGFWWTVLAYRGEQVEATVTAVRDARGTSRHLYYTLADPDGHRIPGELGQWPATAGSDNSEGRTGDRVTVVRDPEGLVDPRLPGELPGTWIIYVIGLVAYAAIAVLCILAGRPETDGYTKPSRPRRQRSQRSAAKSGATPRRKGRTSRRPANHPDKR
jgi:hypothetical protein